MHLSCGNRFQFKNNADKSNTVENGEYVYHIASNGSKVLEISHGKRKYQWILSESSAGKRLEQRVDGKKIKDSLSDGKSDEEIIFREVNQVFPWKTDPKIDLPDFSLGLDFGLYMQKLLKIDCAHVIEKKITDSKKACEQSNGSYVEEEDVDVYYQHDQDLTEEKMAKEILSLLSGQKKCALAEKSKNSIHLKNAFNCKCNNEPMLVWGGKCNRIDSEVAK